MGDDFWTRLAHCQNGNSSYPAVTLQRSEVIELEAHLRDRDNRIRELEQQLSVGIAAWKANNAHFAGELQALRGRVRWIPVSDRLPLRPDAGIVFEEQACIVPDGKRVGVTAYQRGNDFCRAWAQWSYYGDILPGSITAWMAMPAIGPLPGEG